jgi:MoaA/NifB/PqqE/SkfB family radical SAM enzyme
MTAERFSPNQFRHAATIDAPRVYRDGQWRTFEPPSPVERSLRGRRWLLRPGITFTPYANPTRCNAHCAFCSEELQRLDATRLSAHTVIADYDRYFSALDRAFADLAGLSIGLSLSGLEATSEPEWLLRLLSLIERHPALFAEKVLYSNGSGLCVDARIAPALARVGFDRVELSRAHFDAKTNHKIMRFDLAQPVRRAEAFAETVARTQREGVPVKLVCILNAQGVRSIDDVERYLDHAEALGVARVVFRELSALGAIYRENRETRWIDANRVSVRALMDELLGDDGVARPGWALEGVTSGYYYYNERYRRGPVEVTLEGSSYVAHHDAVESGVLQKLVFHSTRELCGDWVPDAQRIGSYDE